MEQETQESRQERRARERREESMGMRRKNMGRRFLIWGSALIVIGLLVWGVVAAVQNVPQGGTVATVSELDHVRGNPDAKTILVEYSDFQCPACAYYESFVKQILADHGQDLQFVYRHFPLTTLHKNAALAAHASEAAAKQGKFWEMHDKLLENQTKWAESNDAKRIFIDYAIDLKLDTKKFEEDLTSDEVKSRVNIDITSGNAANVQATPTFYLNGKEVTPLKDYAEFKAAIENAIQTP